MKNNRTFLLLVIIFVVAIDLLFVRTFLSKEVKEEVQFTIDSAPCVDVFHYAKMYSEWYGVPFRFVYEVGLNESGWKKPLDTSFVRLCEIPGEDSRGDLQVNMKYYPEDKPVTRLALLEHGISLMGDYYHKYKDWRKVRFAYARYKLRHDSTWTATERKFMNAMTFNY